MGLAAYCIVLKDMANLSSNGLYGVVCALMVAFFRRFG